MAERYEARESPNVRQLIDRYLEEHAAKLAKRNRLGEILRKMFNLAIRWRIRADNPAAGFARNAEAPRDR